MKVSTKFNLIDLPVYNPPIGVRTPDALLTAVLVNDPVFGNDWNREPRMLLNPSAIIS
jgi:hypothetical protein